MRVPCFSVFMCVIMRGLALSAMLMVVIMAVRLLASRTRGLRLFGRCALFFL
jgi:hypothetical protein